VDSPFHFAVGDQTVDQLSLNSLIGPCRVYDFQSVHAIGKEALARAGVGDVPRVLFKTNNSRWIRTGPLPALPTHLTADAASYLVDKGILLVGLDGLTVDAPDGADVHLTLLRAGLIIVETLDLSQVAPGDYDLICLPLRIAAADGAPARAVLRPR
jgi:arylformamidase